jgi:hypothetical protein
MLRGGNSTLKRLPKIGWVSVVLDCTVAHHAFLLDETAGRGVGSSSG